MSDWIGFSVLVTVFIILVVDDSLWKWLLERLLPGVHDLIYPRVSLWQLVKEHFVMVLVSSGLAILAGLPLGIFVTRPAGRDFLQIVNDLTSLVQTFPPVAVLALATPFLGFGFKTTVIALFLYSILSVIRNTVVGIEAVSHELIEAATGMGMNRWQILRKVELPLAMKVIMAGIKNTVVINVGTATIGAVVSAGGLGVPIIAGLVWENPAYILEGAIPAALLALIFEQALTKLENIFGGFPN
jgi:osmoprotectant transport system permease protein